MAPAALVVGGTDRRRTRCRCVDRRDRAPRRRHRSRPGPDQPEGTQPTIPGTRRTHDRAGSHHEVPGTTGLGPTGAAVDRRWDGCITVTTAAGSATGCPEIDAELDHLEQRVFVADLDGPVLITSGSADPLVDLTATLDTADFASRCRWDDVAPRVPDGGLVELVVCNDTGVMALTMRTGTFEATMRRVVLHASVTHPAGRRRARDRRTGRRDARSTGVHGRGRRCLDVQHPAAGRPVGVEGDVQLPSGRCEHRRSRTRRFGRRRRPRARHRHCRPLHLRPSARCHGTEQRMLDRLGRPTPAGARALEHRDRHRLHRGSGLPHDRSGPDTTRTSRRLDLAGIARRRRSLVDHRQRHRDRGLLVPGRRRFRLGGLAGVDGARIPPVLAGADRCDPGPADDRRLRRRTARDARSTRHRSRVPVRTNASSRSDLPGCRCSSPRSTSVATTRSPVRSSTSGSDEEFDENDPIGWRADEVLVGEVCARGETVGRDLCI